MSNLASLQVYFNKLTMQRLKLIEIAADKAFVRRATEINAIAKDHGVDTTKDKATLVHLCTWELPGIINLKMENFYNMIAELAEEDNKVAK